MPERDPELAALSAALGALAPTPPALDRDRLFFEAGRRAARPSRRGWPLVACGFALLAAGLGLRLATAPVPTPIERVVVVNAPATRESERPKVENRTAVVRAPNSAETFVRHPANAPYLRLRDQALFFGADALPNLPTTRSEPPATPLRVRDPLDVGMPSHWFLPIS